MQRQAPPCIDSSFTSAKYPNDNVYEQQFRVRLGPRLHRRIRLQSSLSSNPEQECRKGPHLLVVSSLTGRVLATLLAMCTIPSLSGTGLRRPRAHSPVQRAPGLPRRGEPSLDSARFCYKLNFVSASPSPSPPPPPDHRRRRRRPNRLPGQPPRIHLHQRRGPLRPAEPVVALCGDTPTCLVTAIARARSALCHATTARASRFHLWALVAQPQPQPAGTSHADYRCCSSTATMRRRSSQRPSSRAVHCAISARVAPWPVTMRRSGDRPRPSDTSPTTFNHANYPKGCSRPPPTGSCTGTRTQTEAPTPRAADL